MAKITLDNGMQFEGTAEELREVFEEFGVKFDGAETPDQAVEPSEEEAPTVKVGEYVRFHNDGLDYTAGKIYEVAKSGVMGDDFMIIDDAGDEHYFDSDDNYEVVEIIEGTPQVGDKILVTDRDSGEDRFENGDIFTVDEVDYDDDIYVEFSGGRALVLRREFVIIERSAEVEPKPKVGDYVKVTTNVHEHNVGDILEIIENNTTVFDARVKNVIAGRTGFIDFENVALISEEEVAEYKEAAVFTKIGRKPGEIKKGDIIKTLNYGFLEVDDINENVSHPVRVTIDGVKNGMMSEFCTLVAPVESRVDIDA